jgi:hypothetical protein
VSLPQYRDASLPNRASGKTTYADVLGIPIQLADGTTAVVEGNSNLLGTPASTTVAVATSSGELLAANPSRRAATIFNAATQVLYVSIGSAATTSSFPVQPNSLYVAPAGSVAAIYGIWAGADSGGAARVTEYSGDNG